MLYKNTSLKQIMLTSALAGVHVLMLVVEKDLGAAVIFFVTYIVMPVSYTHLVSKDGR